MLGEQYQLILDQPVSLNVENDDSDVKAPAIEMRFDLSVTEKLQLTKSHRGQGPFKANVRLIETAFRVTGVTQISMLRASHINPWSVADDVEKIMASMDYFLHLKSITCLIMAINLLNPSV